MNTDRLVGLPVNWTDDDVSNGRAKGCKKKINAKIIDAAYLIVVADD